MQENNYKKVPQLRFLGFEGDWEVKRYGDIYSFYTTNSLSRAKLNYEKGTVKNIHYGDIHKSLASTLDVSKELLPFINEDVDLSRIKEENYCQVNDLVIADASEDYADIGKTTEIVNLDGGRVLAGLHTFLARPDKQKMALGFTTYLVNSWFVRKQILTIAQGTKVLSLSTTRLAEVNLPVPTLPEQQKIANFLSSIDKQISLLEQKTEQLEAFKKGTMQQLFSQKLRFKDENGEGFPAWEVKRLGDLGTTFNGLSGKTKKDFGTGCKFITYKQVFDSASINVNNFQFVKINQGEKQHKVRKGDIFFTTSSETAKDAGFSSVILQDVENLYLNSFCFGYRPNSFELLYPLFAKYLFRNELFRRKITKLAQGTTRFNISKVKTMLLQVELPSLPEQKKIADFLSSIDQQIQGSRAQLEASKTYKKGLLQQLLV